MLLIDLVVLRSRHHIDIGYWVHVARCATAVDGVVWRSLMSVVSLVESALTGACCALPHLLVPPDALIVSQVCPFNI